MFLLYIGVYSFFLVVIWSFFVIAKLHSDKFKHFSNHISKVTKLLFFFLLVLSIIGYVIIFYTGNYSSFSVKQEPGKTVEENFY